MNWKRGLTRLYVVAWAVFALAGGFVAYSNSDNALRPRREMKEFLRRNAGVVSLADLRTMPTEELAARIRSRALATAATPDSSRGSFEPDAGGIALPDLKDDYEGLSPLVHAQMAAREDTALKDISWAWALWILVCGVAPAALLAIVAWVISGFRR